MVFFGDDIWQNKNMSMYSSTHLTIDMTHTKYNSWKFMQEFLCWRYIMQDGYKPLYRGIVISIGNKSALSSYYFSIKNKKYQQSEHALTYVYRIFEIFSPMCLSFTGYFEMIVMIVRKIIDRFVDEVCIFVLIMKNVLPFQNVDT